VGFAKDLDITRLALAFRQCGIPFRADLQPARLFFFAVAA
jgi:hypothetical protein